MKKQKKKGKHRNAGPPRTATPRASPRKPSDAPPGMSGGEVAALVAGSAVSGSLGALAERTSPTVAYVTSGALAVGGLMGAVLGHGPVRGASAGVLGASVGHVATQLLSKTKASAHHADDKDKERSDPPPAERRQAALPPASEPELPPTLHDELVRAHAAVAALYPDGYDAQRFAA